MSTVEDVMNGLRRYTDLVATYDAEKAALDARRREIEQQEAALDARTLAILASLHAPSSPVAHADAIPAFLIPEGTEPRGLGPGIMLLAARPALDPLDPLDLLGHALIAATPSDETAQSDAEPDETDLVVALDSDDRTTSAAVTVATVATVPADLPDAPAAADTLDPPEVMCRKCNVNPARIPKAAPSFCHSCRLKASWETRRQKGAGPGNPEGPKGKEQPARATGNNAEPVGKLPPDAGPDAETPPEKDLTPTLAVAASPLGDQFTGDPARLAALGTRHATYWLPAARSEGIQDPKCHADGVFLVVLVQSNDLLQHRRAWDYEAKPGEVVLDRCERSGRDWFSRTLGKRIGRVPDGMPVLSAGNAAALPRDWVFVTDRGERLHGQGALAAAEEAGKERFAAAKQFDILVDCRTPAMGGEPGMLLPVACYEMRDGHRARERCYLPSGSELEWVGQVLDGRIHG